MCLICCFLTNWATSQSFHISPSNCRLFGNPNRGIHWAIDRKLISNYFNTAAAFYQSLSDYSLWKIKTKKQTHTLLWPDYLTSLQICCLTLLSPNKSADCKPVLSFFTVDKCYYLAFNPPWPTSVSVFVVVLQVKSEWPCMKCLSHPWSLSTL